MPADRPRPGPPDPLPRLADILGRASDGDRPTPLELAELLWLARQMEPPAADTPVPDPGPNPGPNPDQDPDPAAGPPEAPPDVPDAPPARNGAPSSAPPPPDDFPAPPRPSPEAPRTPLRLPSPSPAPAPGTSAAEPHSALLAPAPPMLRHPLALQRALRPLKRRTEAPAGREVDESATADRIARLGAGPEWWLPVLRPVRERWLRLHLVHDAGPTMPVWQPLVRELHATLAQSGVFRTVTLHRADPDGTVGGGAPDASDGRTVTLLISDCMGPQWREGEAGTRWYGLLRRWARRMPLAVLQPLPEQLWRDTALPPVPGRFSAPHRAAPTASLTFTPYDTTAPYDMTAPYDPTPPHDPATPYDPTAPPAAGAAHVPVLEPGPEWLANWAALVASPGGTLYPGAAATLHRPLPADADDRTDATRLSPEELVLRFRASASPAAFRLAGHLALGRPDLPVMRLVQAAVEPDPRPQHLAEVILSGLLTTVDGPPGSYAFRPGVRELLLRGLPRTARGRTHELLARTGGLIDERAGRAPGEFRALVPSREGTERADGTESFATISPESAGRLTVRPTAGAPPHVPFPGGLGARYRPARRLSPNGRMWLAEDNETNRTVAIRLHDPLPDRAARRTFLRDARRLTAFSHPNVVAVLDAGIEEDVPYVVMEHLDGIALNVLVRQDDQRLPVPLTVSVGAQLAEALTALHEAGLTHGGLETSKVVLLPDGAVRLSLFEPGGASGPAGRSGDLRALCEVMLVLTAGTSRLTVPIDSRRLDRSLGAARIHYAHAFDLMMSASPAAQTQGLRLLADPRLPSQAAAAHPRRRYQALGPLRVTLPDGSPKPPPDVRALLAILLLKHGRTVTHEELRWGLWDPGDEPRNPRGELTRLAARLADLLGPGVLARPAHGYALHTSADDLDLVRCDELVRRADAARLRDAHAEARELVAEALSLWRGPEPLADVPGPAARTARTHLLRLRLALCTRRAEHDLALGAYDRAAADLSDLLRAHPHREDFRRLYLIALRRQGRSEEALEVYEEYVLSGGRSPALTALGRELREEHAVPAEEAEPALEDMDDTPDVDAIPSPSAQETESTATREALEGDADGGGTDADRDADDGGDFDTDYRDCARFSFADTPRTAGDHAALRAVVTALLADSGLDHTAYERVADAPDQGQLLLLDPRVEITPLLAATVSGLPGLLARVEGLRLRVEFWQVEYRLDGTGEQDFRADPRTVAAALDTSAAQAVVALSDSLYYDEVYEPDAAGPAPALSPDLFHPLDDDTGWYRLLDAPAPGP